MEKTVISRMIYNLSLHDTVRYGCARRFKMSRGSTRICGAHLKYFQLYKTSGYIFEKYKEGDFTPKSDFFEDAAFLFSSE